MYAAKRRGDAQVDGREALDLKASLEKRICGAVHLPNVQVLPLDRGACQLVPYGFEPFAVATPL